MGLKDNRKKIERAIVDLVKNEPAPLHKKRKELNRLLSVIAEQLSIVTEAEAAEAAEAKSQ